MLFAMWEIWGKVEEDLHKNGRLRGENVEGFSVVWVIEFERNEGRRLRISFLFFSL